MERYNKCIAAGGDYFKVEKSVMCVLSIKVAIRKKSGNLFNDLRISVELHVMNAPTEVLLCYHTTIFFLKRALKRKQSNIY